MSMTTDRAKRYAANRGAWVLARPGRSADHKTYAEIVYESLCGHMRDFVESMYAQGLSVNACTCCDGGSLRCKQCGLEVSGLQFLFTPEYGGEMP